MFGKIRGKGKEKKIKGEKGERGKKKNPTTRDGFRKITRREKEKTKKNFFSWMK